MSSSKVTLGPGPEVVPLTTWTENNLSAIYKATTQAEFDSAFEAFFQDNVTITLNGKTLTREQYKSQLSSEKLGEKSADISFLGAVEVPATTVGLQQTGSVGIFYKATIFGRFYYEGAPIASTVNSSFNAVVTADPSGGAKVSTLNEVIVDQVDR